MNKQIEHTFTWYRRLMFYSSEGHDDNLIWLDKIKPYYNELHNKSDKRLAKKIIRVFLENYYGEDATMFVSLW